MIEGVPVGVAGFAGVAPYGPVDEARLVTTVEEFATVYGAGGGVGGEGEGEASDSDGGRPHYLAEAVGAFFVNGGRRLYVSRIGHGLAAALEALAAVDEISMVAAPGMADASSDLIAHAERTGCFALIDAPAGTSVDDVRRFRARFDSGHAAIHHPWIVVGGAALPPSGFVAGVYARGDLERGVPKPSTGDAVRGAAALESVVEDSERALLNDDGVNVLRPIEDEGIRIWGARTMSSDPEWKYVNIRRYLIFLEHSIDKGTQWAVFEPNGEELWARVRQAVEEFLSGQWHFGALRGRRPEEAFFVRCDPTTMTQDDIDGGRLVAMIGVGPVAAGRVRDRPDRPVDGGPAVPVGPQDRPGCSVGVRTGFADPATGRSAGRTRRRSPPACRSRTGSPRRWWAVTSAGAWSAAGGTSAVASSAVGRSAGASSAGASSAVAGRWGW